MEFSRDQERDLFMSSSKSIIQEIQEIKFIGAKLHIHPTMFCNRTASLSLKLREDNIIAIHFLRIAKIECNIVSNNLVQ